MVISGNNLVINGTTVEAADLTNVASITSDVQTQLNSKANTSTVNSQVWDYSQMPAGSVLQVVFKKLTADQTIATETYTDISDSSIVFTPKSSTSTIIIKAHCHVYINGSSSSWHSLNLRVIRDSTDLGGYLPSDPYTSGTVGVTETMYQTMIEVKDMIGGIQPVTYKIQGSSKNAFTARLNRFSHGEIQIMEVA